MSGTTSDPNDPRIKRGGPDTEPGPQHETYLVLSPEERAKGFVRPYRTVYRHVGPLGPTHPLEDLDEATRERYAGEGYVKFEPYPPDGSSVIGRYWTQAQLNAVGKACGTETTMSHEIAETYARQPEFYGSTYCVRCRLHLDVGEFVWTGTEERVGS